MHLTKQVKLLIDLAELLLELEDVFSRVRVKLLELLFGLFQSVLLIRLPSIVIF